MKKIRLAVLGSVVGILAACSSTPNQQAPVVERTSSGKPAEAASAAAPAAAPAGRGYYTVKKGDTLYRIALEAGQSYRDIVAWNNLSNPNDIKVDQVLRVAPPDGAGGQAQTAAVAPVPASGIEVKPLGAPGAATPAATAAGVSNKTGPHGDKRAYSESALAELEKPDTAAAPAATAPAAPAKAEPAHPAEKPAPVATDDEGVSWMWPAEGKVVGTFDGGKKGLDIAGKSGQPVLAAGAGKVMYAGSGIRGYGNLVIIKHTNNLLSAYAHNKAILVKEGQSVTKGQRIAEMGNSDSDSVKLHFEIRQQGKPVDPAKYLPPR
ncbi:MULTISPECIES: peptidoglycan DD-metalloendopeptidase family protein [unclassified Herbaspirillum]|uniref:peptidoglycan DD-metalloendopeptidase family protein n=1 Tax=unclassified Herbaspirillum TaxID=2624150 RepID=UPI001153AEAA|nr:MULTISPECIES: peptidoglycan DD-metalloendopeptidase family protein [unclassified Herbaspirillum]MBB5393583.1 lipoprotein NlpD [Herbaspirillum sp. SJZ102]TQK03670.1 lipoprotein NlpD [Herbaspirillum sp. SJZ130]TQK08402.1 lipoprotein NlpD [Herbaspirillum sp. SJZ106]